MQGDYSTGDWAPCIAWIQNWRKKNRPWEDLRLCLKKDEAGCQEKLDEQVDFDGWPKMSVEKWQDFVAFCEDFEKKSIGATIPKIKKLPGQKDLPAPVNANSCWQLYKEYLIADKGFSIMAMEEIEKRTVEVLNHLQLKDADGHEAVKGLVVGNVQSGKTANMGALMSMAADNGINLFIVLTGTINSLREQTETRFKDDLRNGNLSWNVQPNPGFAGGLSLSQLQLGDGQNTRYLICCLKNSTRLARLKAWLNSDVNIKRQLRVLVIDDEADEAGINTCDISAEERSRINKLITDIVNNTHNKNKTDYDAMNYVAYTATPYANFLNETGRESLYPRNFITVLSPSDLYFGPQQIFGTSYTAEWQGMPILNAIPGEHHRGKQEATGDVLQLDNICDEDADGTEYLPPVSLQRAIAWFCVATAIRRVQKDKAPSTMLIHHSMKTGNHLNLGNCIYDWLTNDISEADFLALCREVYTEQTQQFTKGILQDTFPGYGKSAGVDIATGVENYPAFKSLEKHLRTLKGKLEHIMLEGEPKKGEILKAKFHKGIHMCIDNCKYQIVADAPEEGMAHVRLLYPKKSELQANDYAPAFMVIGGNTLSRGLTLEGLVCTYFSREVKQADTLMQMGRWFGYRRGYELLPRLWLTAAAQNRFCFLSDLDYDLRINLYRYRGDITPLDGAPSILNDTPAVAAMRITGAKKMQGAVEDETQMNFGGARLQTVNFINDKAELEGNLQRAEEFIKDLGADDAELAAQSKNTRRVWKDIKFDVIWNKLLKNSNYQLSQLDDIDIIRKWVEAINKEGKLGDWDVVLSGIAEGGHGSWNGVNKVLRTRKISGAMTEDSAEFTIGVLSDPKDWAADIPDLEQRIATYRQEKGLKEKEALNENMKDEIREQAGKGNTPLLVMYCIDKNSEPVKKAGTRQDGKPYRARLNTEADVIGIAIRIPGQRTNKSYCTHVTVKIEE